MAIIEDYMFYPGKVENVVVIIETDEKSVFSLPIKVSEWFINKETGYLIGNLQQNFPNCLAELYVLNSSINLDL